MSILKPGLTVSASKADKYRYWLAWFVEDMPVGETFRSGALHLTILTWLVSARTESQLIESFMADFNDFEAFDIAIGPRATLAGRAPVNLVTSAQLPKLEERALQWFAKNECRWAVKNPYAGAEFKPHIRRRAGSKLAEGQVLTFNALTLVRARRQEDGQRYVAAKVRFR